LWRQTHGFGGFHGDSALEDVDQESCVREPSVLIEESGCVNEKELGPAVLRNVVAALWLGRGEWCLEVSRERLSSELGVDRATSRCEGCAGVGCGVGS
jgi:hypothetical protein